MADNFNINTTQGQSFEAGGVDPNDPSQNLGNQIAMNQLKQQEASQLVQQAVERTKQSKLGTQQEQTLTDTQAYLSEKGLMPKEQAIGELKILLQKQGMDDDQTNQIVQQAETQWPEELDGAAIWRWFSAIKEPKASKLGEGQPFQADGSQKNADGTAYPKGTWLQDIVDSDGDHQYVQSAQPASIQTAGAKGGAVDQKRKTDLVKLLGKQLEARRGNWLSQGLYRCSVALQKLDSTPNMTKQDLYQIAQDISAIFTGGVPTEDEILNSSYGTKMTEILNTLGSWTGKVFGVPLNEIRQKLVSVVQPLYDELIHRFETLMDFYAQGYQDVISADPDWWNQTKQKAVQAAEHKQSVGVAVETGNIMPIGSGIPPMTPQTAQSSAGAPNDPLGIR